MLAPMRTAGSIPALVILAALAGTPAVATGEPALETTAAPPVDDAAWTALQGRQVVIDTPAGAVAGELLRSDGDTLVVVQADGRVATVAKAEATGVRLVQAPASGGTTAPIGPAPAPAPSPAPTPVATTPAPAATTTPAPAATAPTDPAAAATAEEELSPREQRRKERREKREHAILGAFTIKRR